MVIKCDKIKIIRWPRPPWLGCPVLTKILNFMMQSWIGVRLWMNITGKIFFSISSTGTFNTRGSKSAQIAKCRKKFSLEFCWYYSQNLRNKIPIAIIYFILLYDKYFLSYHRFSSVFRNFRQICSKTTLTSRLLEKYLS